MTEAYALKAAKFDPGTPSYNVALSEENYEDYYRSMDIYIESIIV